MDGKIAPAQIDHYRRLVEIHEAIKDPLVMIKRGDLSALIDTYEWTHAEKPRVRRTAPSVPT